MRICLFAFLLFFSATTWGQEIVPRVVSSNLKNPCGIAIRPVTGEVYIADTGRGRVVELQQDSIKDVVTGFPIEEFELDREIVLGPVSLLFKNRNRLIVGTGGAPDGEDSIMVFDLEKLGREPFEAGKDNESVLKLEATGDEPAEGDFFAMAATRNQLYVSCHGSDKGWIATADLIADEVQDLKRYLPTAIKSGMPGPGGIAISPEGHLVVSQMGKRDEAGDSTLCFYNDKGKLLDKFETGLNDIVALAYGPKNGNLYALDFSWVDPNKGGLYKLVAVDSKVGCEAVLVAKLPRPTSMAFDQSGRLWVTVCGIPDANSNRLDAEFISTGKVMLFPVIDK